MFCFTTKDVQLTIVQQFNSREQRHTLIYLLIYTLSRSTNANEQMTSHNFQEGSISFIQELAND
jgi:hypothetical protein